jgi:hypothetical protein
MQRCPGDLRQIISVHRISPGKCGTQDDVMPPIRGRGRRNRLQKTPALRRFGAITAEFRYREAKTAAQAYCGVHDEFPATFRLSPSP